MVKYQKSQATYDALLDAAAIEFWTHGVVGARIVDILRRAEISQGAMYHHVTTKFEVADAILEKAASEWISIREGLSSSPTRGLELVLALSRTMATSMEASALLRASVHIYGRPGVSKELPDPLKPWQELMTIAFQQAIADREARDSLDIGTSVQVIVDLVLGATRAITNDTHTLDPSARVSAGVGRMLDGIRWHGPQFSAAISAKE